jgi:hypothetical protein
MEAEMNRGRIVTMAIPLLIGSGLLLSACASEPDYAAPAYAYDYPDYPYGSLDFDYWGGGGWGHDHRGGGDHGHGGGHR